MGVRWPGLCCALALVVAAPASAAGIDGAIDRGFGRDGIVATPFGTTAVAGAAQVQPDGRIVTAGEVIAGNVAKVVSTRINPDGTPDTTYGDGGTVIVDINGSAAANTLALQRDGRIVLAGTGKDPVSGALAFAAVRLMPDGSRDRTFGEDGVAIVQIGHQSIANGVGIQSDGSIILAGGALVGDRTASTLVSAGNLLLGTAGLGYTPVGSNIGSAFGAGTLQAEAVFAATRLTPDGRLDRTFGDAGTRTIGSAAIAWGMAMQPDDRPVLMGQQTVGGTDVYMAARLLPDGAPDPGFGTRGIVSVPVGKKAFGDAVAVLPDGRIILAGAGYTDRLLASTVRLLPDGRIDTTYGEGGTSSVPVNAGVNAVTRQRDGKILMGATGATAIRVTADGRPDPEFGEDGVAEAKFGSADAANGVTTQPDGKILLSGGATYRGRVELTVVRLSSRDLRPPPDTRRRVVRLTTCLPVRRGARATRCRSRVAARAVVFRRGATGRARLHRRGRTVATGDIDGATLVLRARRAVRPGRYRLTITYAGNPRRVTRQIVAIR